MPRKPRASPPSTNPPASGAAPGPQPRKSRGAGRVRVTSTYRLQLNEKFTFADAARAVPYIASLGVSHLYLSPITTARPGSTHGYDVTDHSTINPELGGLAGLYDLSAVLRAHDMGLVVDIVPNHVSIDAANPWWRDVLRFGERSPFAPYFDIEWSGPPYRPGGVLILPVLGASCGAALESGELRFAYDGDELVLDYRGRTFPISPASYADVLGLPDTGFAERAPGLGGRLLEVVDAVRQDDRSEALRAVAALSRTAADQPEVRAYIDARVAEINADVSRAEAAVAKQHYRLAYWRVSGEETNYRRFFDVNELAAIRVEHPPVFDAVHGLLADLVRAGVISGVRIDHIDGLFDPAGYIERLKGLLAEVSPAGEVPIWVEKILGARETLPDWPVAGTTGYEFISRCGGLFIHPRAERAITASYEEFVGSRRSYERVAFESRLYVAERLFAGEVGVLAGQLFRIAQRERKARDITLSAFREALASLFASFPVYRTYAEAPEVTSAVLDAAAASAARLDPEVSREALELALAVLRNEFPAAGDDVGARFRARFQQVAAPVMAKGVEDTAFFRYTRFVGANEVGGDPAVWARSPGEVHPWLEARTAHPLALSASSTHDTKRSEDARARLYAISEFPEVWRRELRAWSRLNARFERSVHGSIVPGPATEHYLYQTLIAAWPGASDAAFRERMAEHMVKARREAKQETAWMRPGEAYESALRTFVKAILDPRISRRFLRRLDLFVQMIEPAAAAGSLAMLTLKCLAPGVPDVYQGAEWPIHTLTDPDNRGIVAFPGEATALQDFGAPVDPATKLAVTQRLLGLRRRNAAFFDSADYRAIGASGEGSGHVFAFTRTDGRRELAVVAPRLLRGMLDGAGCLKAGALASVQVVAGGGGPWQNRLTGERHAPSSAGELRAGDLLSTLPVAVLTRGRFA